MKTDFKKWSLIFIIILYSIITENHNFNISAIYKDEYIDGEINILFKSEVNDKILKDLLKIENINADILLIDGDFANIKVDNQDLNVIVNKFNKIPYVIKAEPNYVLQPTNDNDIFDIKLRKSIDNIDLSNDTDKNRDILVAVIDTGIDINHPDLRDSIWINSNEIENDDIDNDYNGYVDDINGWDFYNNDNSLCSYQYDKDIEQNVSSYNDCDDHGTHVAGIILSNYRKFNTNINTNIKIICLKIQGGKNRSGSISSAITAINYATACGAKICNISLGSYSHSKIMEEIIKESNMLFVTAAGNNGNDNDEHPVYPASYDINKIISVTYIDEEGKLAQNANYGLNSVDIATSGVNIYSTIVGGGYAQMSGSSMSTPYVTAIAALLYSYNYFTFPDNVKEVISEYLNDNSLLNGYVKYPGDLNVQNIVGNIDKLKFDNEEPTINYSYIYDGLDFQLNIEIKDIGGSGIFISRSRREENKK